jgi:HTH-type transcriptional regulator / antitoxin HigA
MNIKPIHSERDYRLALKEIEGLMDARPSSPEGDRFDVLATLVQAWEEKHHAIEAPDTIDAVKFAMEQRGGAKAIDE